MKFDQGKTQDKREGNNYIANLAVTVVLGQTITVQNVTRKKKNVKINLRESK